MLFRSLAAAHEEGPRDDAHEQGENGPAEEDGEEDGDQAVIVVCMWPEACKLCIEGDGNRACVALHRTLAPECCRRRERGSIR